MSWYAYSKPYVTVAQRQRNAAREAAKLRRAGQTISPVEIKGRAIAATAWGKAWCGHLDAYQDFENRLPRGRAYVRNGSVIDLQIAPRLVTALVSGSDIYRVKVEIGAVPEPAWRVIRADCAGQIESLIELLQGRLSKGVMERLCRQEQGLFPQPSDIRFSCSCPDYAGMCKHVAAALYGVGAKLDTMPELLFRLRDVDAAELTAEAGTTVPRSGETKSDRILGESDVAALFGIDIATSAASDAEAPPTLPGRDAGKKTERTKTANSRPSQKEVVSATEQKLRTTVAKPATRPDGTSKAAKTGTLDKPTGQTTSSKATRHTAISHPPADKPVKWWLKPKRAKPSRPAGPAKRKRG